MLLLALLACAAQPTTQDQASSPVACEPDRALFSADGEGWRDETEALLAGDYLAESGTLRLCEGELAARIIVEGVALSIEGQGADLSRLVGSGEAGIVVVEDGTLSLRDLTLAGGFAERGGALSAVDSSLVLEGVSLDDNASLAKGGAVWLSGGQASLTAVDFDGNQAGDDGGGLAAEDGAILELSDLVFVRNTAPDKGGGLFLNLEASADGTDVTFSQNQAAWGGGLALLDGAGLALSASRISGNEALDRGGGLHVNNSAAELVEVSIGDNLAGDWAGGLGVENGATVWGTDLYISDNEAVGRGGGVGGRFEVTLSLQGSTLNQNEAGTAGGALYLGDGSEVELVGGLVYENEAVEHGGGLALEQQSSGRISLVGFYRNEPDDTYLLDQDLSCYMDADAVITLPDDC